MKTYLEMNEKVADILQHGGKATVIYQLSQDMVSLPS